MSNDFDEDDLVTFRCTSLTGRDMLGFTAGTKLAFRSESDAPTKLNDWPGYLVRADFPLTTGKPLEQVRAALNDIADQDGYYVADQPGFNGPAFALVDGTLFLRADAPPTHAGYESSADAFHRAGNVNGWQTAVADFVRGEPVLTTVLAIGFAAPLLNLISHPAALSFELVGGMGTQVEVAGLLLSSMTGRPDAVGRSLQPIEARSFIVRAENHFYRLCHLPMVVDNSTLYWQFAHTPKVFAQAQSLLSFAREQTDATFLLVGDRSVVSHLAGFPDLAEVAGTRLMTINVGQTGEGHIFVNDPPDGLTKGELAHRLSIAVQGHHGVILPAFLQRLVQEQHDNETALLTSVEQDVARFRTRVEPDTNNSHAVEVANAFGLLFAALRLARKYELIPEGLRSEPMIERAYRHYLVRPVAFGNLATTLDQLAGAATTLRLGKDAPVHSAKRVRRTNVFTLQQPNYIEVMIRPSEIADYIEGWSARLKHRDVLDLLVRDGNHLAV